MRGIRPSRRARRDRAENSAAAIAVAAVLFVGACGSPEGPHYTVTPGDSGRLIAHYLAIDLEELESLNPEVDWDRLRPGQRLRIPSLAPSYAPRGLGSYRVRPRDTGLGIADELGVPFRELVRLNPTTDWYRLPVGTEIQYVIAEWPPRTGRRARNASGGPEPDSDEAPPIGSRGSAPVVEELLVEYRGPRLRTVDPRVTDPSGRALVDLLPLRGNPLRHETARCRRIPKGQALAIRGLAIDERTVELSTEETSQLTPRLDTTGALPSAVAVTFCRTGGRA